MKRLVVIIVWAVVLAVFSYFIISNLDELKKLLRFSVFDLMTLIFLFIFTQFLNGAKLMLLMRKIGLKVNAAECFNISNINTVINYLPFKGGVFATAFYFKSKHDLRYTEFLNIFLAGHLIELLALMLFASVSIVLHYLITGTYLVNLAYIFFISTAVVFLCVLAVKKYFSKIERFTARWDILKRSVGSLNMILSDNRLLVNILLVNLLSMLVMCSRIAVSFNMLSFKAPLIMSFLAGQVRTIGTLLSIIPAGLGVAELLAGGISDMMGSGMKIGIYAVSVDRAVSILTLILLSIYSFTFLYRRRPAG